MDKIKSKGYLSHSQYSLWKSSPKNYYLKYGLGIKDFTSKYFFFGKKFMSDLEFDQPIDLPPDSYKKLDLLSGIEVMLGSSIPFSLLGIIDSLSSDGAEFREYKTGIGKWTQAKVNKDSQLLFYAYLIYLNYKVIPTAKLIWVETAETDEGVIFFTGNVKSFTRTFTLEDILWMQEDIRKTLIEIEEYEHNEEIIETDVAETLYDLMSLEKDINIKSSAIKDYVLADLINKNVKYGVSPYGNFTIGSRSKYKYSQELEDKRAEFEGILSDLERHEEQKGIAVLETTPYLLYKPKNYLKDGKK